MRKLQNHFTRCQGDPKLGNWIIETENMFKKLKHNSVIEEANKIRNSVLFNGKQNT
jgi:hypothetical protein